MKLRVLLVEDHVLVREGIRSLLGRDTGIEVVGEAETGEEAISLAAETKPDLVIMDVVMAGMTGIEASRKIIRENPGTKIIALSMYDNQSYISRMVEAGVTGYVVKTSAFDELARAIEVVMRGEVYLCGTITSVIVNDYLARMKAGPSGLKATPVLSLREREVLVMISEGKSGADIARELSVTAKTVESHRLHIMDKLKIHSVAGLTKYALREGLTALDR